MSDEFGGEVAAMQFAGGRSMVDVAAEWEQDVEWVEASVRRELLKLIPKRDGGLKPSRTETRAERLGEQQVDGVVQIELMW